MENNVARQVEPKACGGRDPHVSISNRVYLPSFCNNTTMPERRESSQPPAEPQPRSPPRDTKEDRKRHRHAHRSRSPRGDEDRHKHKRHRSRSPLAKTVTLPYKAKPLSKRHYDDYKPLFQSYLDIQKSIQLDELEEREAKGRWKSFISRWYVNTRKGPLKCIDKGFC